MSAGTDLAALRLLVAVAEQGSLSAAARSLGTAQPNASRALGRLERALGVALLHRSTAGSTLTGEGLLVVEWAREVLAAHERLLSGAAALAGTGTARLRLSASQTVAEHLLPAWLAALRVEEPELALGVAVRNSAEVTHDVLAGSADLGFVEGPQEPAGVHSLVVAHDELDLVVSPAHPWARRPEPVTPADLLATPLVTREPGSGTRIALDEALAHAAPVALEVSSNAAVRVAVMAGAGPAVLSRLAVADAVGAGHLVRVPVRGLRLRRSLRAVWHGPRRLTGPAATLVAVAQRHARGGPGSP